MRVLVVPKWYPWPDRPVFGIFCREQARALAPRARRGRCGRRVAPRAFGYSS